jgi:DNA-binding Lrp family transcriptional regulator
LLDDFDQKILDALERKGPQSSRQLAEIIGFSRQAAQARLKRLVAAGHARVEGRARATRYHLAEPRWSRTYDLEGLEEHIAFDELRREFPPARSLEGNAADVLAYAVTEMVNNAIDHSGGSQCELSAVGRPSQLLVEVVDDGVGVFRHVRERLGLPDELAALQEISKGKTTTDEERHSGEGLFFVSKAVTTFAIASGRLRWLVDNVRDDVAIEALDEEIVGTDVAMTLDFDQLPELTSVFDAYTRDLRFVRTRTRVKLFDIGTRFMSRSEAKRLLHGLERFEAVVLDFEGVRTIGQGFADEVFRVWANAHPDVTLEAINMRAPVGFMIRRAQSP